MEGVRCKVVRVVVVVSPEGGAGGGKKAPLSPPSLRGATLAAVYSVQCCTGGVQSQRTEWLRCTATEWTEPQ